MLLLETPLTFRQIIWELVKFGVPTVFSLVALTIALRDRRPQLLLRARKGKWVVMQPVVDGDLVCQGVIEAYNQSGRANAIRSYHFMCEQHEGTWLEMESEMYKNSESTINPCVIHNQTPLTLAPYSGVEVLIEALIKSPRPPTMRMRIEVEDLFGKKHSVVVTAVR